MIERESAIAVRAPFVYRSTTFRLLPIQSADRRVAGPSRFLTLDHPHHMGQRPEFLRQGMPDRPTPVRCVEATQLQRTRFESTVERKLRRKQLTEDGHERSLMLTSALQETSAALMGIFDIGSVIKDDQLRKWY